MTLAERAIRRFAEVVETHLAAIPNLRRAEGDEVADAVAAVLGRLVAIGRKLDAAIDAVLGDSDLAPQGAERKCLAAGAVALGEVDDFIAKTVEPIRASVSRRIGQALGETAIRPPTDPGERLAFELRLAEIRRDLRELGANERMVLYLESADPLVHAAVESAPPALLKREKSQGGAIFVPLVDPDRVNAAKMARAQAAFPAMGEDLARQEGLAERYEGVAKILRRALTDRWPGLKGVAKQ